MGSVSIELRRGSAALAVAAISMVGRYVFGIDQDWMVLGYLLGTPLAVHDFYALHRRRIGRKWRPGGLWQPTHEVTINGESACLVMMVPSTDGGYLPNDPKLSLPDEQFGPPAYSGRREGIELFGYTRDAWKQCGAPQFLQLSLRLGASELLYRLGATSPTYPRLGVDRPKGVGHGEWFREWFRFGEEFPRLFPDMDVGPHLSVDRVERLSKKEARVLRQ